MGEFNGKIVAEFTPPKTWELEKGLSFKTDDLTDAEISTLKQIGANISESGRISCKKGMKTDLASVPRVAWNLVSPWDIARAAVIHDHLYASLRSFYNTSFGEVGPKTKSAHKETWSKGRALADKILLLAMDSADPPVPAWKKGPVYWSVRMFGWGPASKG